MNSILLQTIFETIYIVDCHSSHQNYEWTQTKDMLNKKVSNNSNKFCILDALE